MAKQILNIGTSANDKSGDPLRTAAQKINSNFGELYLYLGNGTELTVAAVAKTGSFNSLVDRPNLNLYALKSETFSGDYNDLRNKPLTADYNTLTNKPDLTQFQTKSEAFSGNYSDLTFKPDLTIYQLKSQAFSGSYNDLTNRPTLAPVATTGSYNSLTDKPAIPNLNTLATVAHTGSYTDLNNKPSIPEDISQLTDTTGLISGGAFRASLVNATGTTTYTVSLDQNGILHLPAGGDIYNAAGTSVLGGGSSGPVRSIEGLVVPQVGTQIVDIEAWAGAGADNGYVWIGNYPNFATLFALGSSIVGWTITSSDNSTTTITEYNPPLGADGIRTAAPLGPAPYVAQSPDYAAGSITPATVVVGDGTWTFTGDGRLDLPRSVGSNSPAIIESSADILLLPLKDNVEQQPYYFGGDQLWIPGNLHFPDNTVQTTAFQGTGTIDFYGDTLVGNGVPQVGTGYHFATEYGDNTVLDNATSLRFPWTPPYQWVEVGMIITFADGTTTRTVTDVRGQDGFIFIDFADPVTLDPAYPVDIRSPDFVPAVDPAVVLYAGGNQLSFSNNKLHLPFGCDIVDHTETSVISGKISVATLKTIVAESVDFADFQSKIAAL